MICSRSRGLSWKLVACGALLALAGVGNAHDYWIAPSTYHSSVGELVQVNLVVGEHFAGDALPRRNDGILRFFDRGPAGEANLFGRDGHAPAGYLRPEAPGLHVLAYEGKPNAIELKGPAFEAYLREEGLEHVVDARAAARTSADPARERYARCAKSLLWIAEDESNAKPAASRLGDGARRPLGLELELLASGDPIFGAAEETLHGTFRLLYRGKPLEGALVMMLTAAEPEPVRARTDASGTVRMQLPDEGAVLVKAVHMVPSTDPSADWSSRWASLTFERAAAPPGARN